jgi:mono/diheme cytochrome c family protein
MIDRRVTLRIGHVLPHCEGPGHMSMALALLHRFTVRLAAPTTLGLAILQFGPAPAAAQGVDASVGRPVPDLAPASPAPEAVIRTYRTICLKCHDTDGKGEIIRDDTPEVPDFTDAAWHATRSDADLSRSILEGKGKSMPSMRRKLGSVDVGRIVAFVRGFRGGKQVVEEDDAVPTARQQVIGSPPQQAVSVPAIPGPISSIAEPSRPSPNDSRLRAGSRTFQRSCVRCHGNDGRGDEMRDTWPSIPDFTVGAWLEAHTDPQLVVSILDGKGTGMPTFRDKLSREQARELVAFIRSFGPPTTRAVRRSPDDFEARFQQLVAEIEGLRRRSEALSSDASATQEAPKSSPPPPR